MTNLIKIFIVGTAALVAGLFGFLVYGQGIYICQGANCPPSLNGILLSNSTFNSGAASGTIVGNLSVLTSGPAFSGSYAAPGGADGAHFQVINSNQLATSGIVAATGSTQNYNIAVTANQATAVNTSITVPITITAQQVPITVTYSPVSPVTVLDNITTTTTISTVTVSTSDGHAFFGSLSLTANAGGRVVLSGNNILPAHNFTSADDGANLTVTVQASENGAAVASSLVLNVTPAVVSAFPLSISGSQLVSPGGAPFFIVGDAPQSLIKLPLGVSSDRLPTASINAFLFDRGQQGVNTLWVNVICESYTFCNNDSSMNNGQKPFTSQLPSGSYTNSAGGTESCPNTAIVDCYDISTPNASYWSVIDQIFTIANTNNIQLFANVLPTDDCPGGGDFMSMLRMNNQAGAGRVNSFADFLANRYKNQPNIVWYVGNDYACWNVAADDNVLFAFASRIHSDELAGGGYVHLITLEVSGGLNSLDDTTNNWASILGLNGVYYGWPAYDLVLRGYNQNHTTVLPYMQETDYESEDFKGNQNGSIDNCAAASFWPAVGNFPVQPLCAIRERHQQWWTALAGGSAGVLYGSHYGSQFLTGSVNWYTPSVMDTPSIQALHYQQKLLANYSNWQKLVPDTTQGGTTGHTFLYSGSSGTACGSYATTNSGNQVTNTYVMGAVTADGSLGIVYFPDGSTTCTVAISKMTGTVTACWYDPTADPGSGSCGATGGSYVSVCNPCTQTNLNSLSASSRPSHADGTQDYVLVLSAVPGTTVSTNLFALATPTTADSGATASREVGTIFTPAYSGQATGVRFYKASTNTGAHCGHLWTATGSLLASITFSGETASGWQNATFSSPQNLTAGTWYVVDYVAPNGHYSRDSGYFNTFYPYQSTDGAMLAPNAMSASSGAGVTSNGYAIIPNDNTGDNGHYSTGTCASPVFPASSEQSTLAPVGINYWVDVNYSYAPNVLNLGLVKWYGGPTYFSGFTGASGSAFATTSFYPIGVWSLNVTSTAPQTTTEDQSYGVNFYYAINGSGSGCDGNICLSAIGAAGQWVFDGPPGQFNTPEGTETPSFFLDDEIDAKLGPGPSTGPCTGVSGTGFTQMNSDKTSLPQSTGRLYSANYGTNVSFMGNGSNACSAVFISLLDIASVDDYWYSYNAGSNGAPNFCSGGNGDSDLPGTGANGGNWNALTTNECVRASNYGDLNVRRLIALSDLAVRDGLASKVIPIYGLPESGMADPTHGVHTTGPQMEGAAMASVINGAGGIAWFSTFDCASQFQGNLRGNCNGNKPNATTIDAVFAYFAPLLTQQTYYWPFALGADTRLQKNSNGNWYLFAMPGYANTLTNFSFTFKLPAGMTAQTSVTEVCGSDGATGESTTCENGTRTIAITGSDPNKSFVDTFANDYSWKVYRINP